MCIRDSGKVSGLILTSGTVPATLIRLDRKVTVPLVLQSLREHMQVILACKARDPEAAAVAMQAHLASALQRGLGLYYGY